MPELSPAEEFEQPTQNSNTFQIDSRKHSYLVKGEGPTVILLHGFPDNAETWQAQIDYLADAGYRCIAPTLRGYESRSLAERYFVMDSVEDVRAIQQQLNLEQFHLIGHDWGAIIGYAFAATYPEALKSLNCLAIPHLSIFNLGLKEVPRQRKNSAYIAFFQIPYLSEWWCRRNNFAFIEWLWRRWSPSWNFTEKDIESVKQQLSQDGVMTATLGFYRHLYRKGREPSQAASVAKIKVPCQVLAGENDGCMDIRMFEILQREKPFLDAYQLHIIDGAGHFMQREQAGKINRLLQEWLDKYERF
ncbi:alpha/beta fold hydrolase [Pseudoteredinibacter isoporae]|uniref:Pimeloyl-ACP methyl ester carboxylesterase n=1 Tax=Pseudoteredinibacter isoporae TaxID=570281 RepID=A0A7X0MWF7_9GAMM|nr:alpha/beta hydrolase [Pseudoteredinibacter isoporae]MBB6522135.1 pimeloyl-ACP methyl ester carboxylesterase [Pseudoteredinibacter isoporae]NHO87670.1 alpha/beta hydrolase [Pseudoteredinibacter isoporae]NIB23999.1 alpha/beta hydrolase [Pseudoteredinibacter isoporae]